MPQLREVAPVRAATEWKAARRFLLAAICVSSSVCSDAALVAPTGSTIDIGVSPTTIASGGDTAVVALLLREQDGTRAENGTEVELIATNGGLCEFDKRAIPPITCSEWPSVLSLRAFEGVATATVRSTGSPGPLVLTARSGSITATATITVSSKVAVTGGKITLQPEKDTVLVGSMTRVMVFVAAQDGSQASDGTRVVLSTPDNTLSKQIVVTRDGFAETTFLAVKPGAATLTAISGPVKGQATIVVK